MSVGQYNARITALADAEFRRGRGDPKKEALLVARRRRFHVAMRRMSAAVAL